MRKLICGHDFLFLGQDIKLAEAGILDEVESVYKLKTNFIYIAFNPQTSDEIILKWQNALDELKQEPIYEKTKDKFLKEHMDQFLKQKPIIA